ncbi:pyrroline-5-carboxylate reductase family protein [Gemmobacter serpentinus]|uniref:pyrroline-5-carboxylate reductase family protein n=1 Tax=Gemmobacter serpentinus TaxID=2652247 RepID=UPI00124D64FC|nr:pyrroline-5-carboxylate reductase dimerization domain-containing protein [Gemmobacter serpentinus]
MRIGIIGATGWLGSALGVRLLQQGVVAPEGLTLLNRSGEPGPYQAWPGVAFAPDLAALVRASDVVVIAVRPETWPELHLHAPDRLVISFMAGIGAAALGASGGRVLRAMPNAAADIGASWTPWWASDAVTPKDRDVTRRILSAIGTEEEIPCEDHIDLMTAVPGSGAAYPALMAQALAEYLIAQGLPEGTAWRAAGAVVSGGARLLEGDASRARDLLAAYLDYRGTTAAGLQAAETAGFSAAIRAAIKAAAQKSADMGR